jgi:hypothetical protein
VSNDEIVMIVGGLIAVFCGAIDLIRTNYQSLSAAGVAVLGVVFILLALL